MEAKSVIFALVVALTVLALSQQVISSRPLPEVAEVVVKFSPQTQDLLIDELIAEQESPESVYQSTQFQDLEEIDRLKLSINKLICGSMEEGCDHMDDAAYQPIDLKDQSTESFASLNLSDHVSEFYA